MAFEHLSFWSPEITDAGTDSRPFSAHTSPLFSPIQCEYESFLEAFQMEIGAIEPSEPVVDNRKENDEENEGGLEEGNLGNAGCKNLLSERNRRRRLNQQLLALRSLVPSISKMDKRSILMDAAAYLQNLHQEIDQLKRELSAQEAPELSSTSSEAIVQSPEESSPVQEASSNQHQIFELDTEELDNRTLSLKVAFKKGRGALCQVQRMIESLGVTTTHILTHETEGQRMLTTCFIQLKRNSTLTGEMLKVQTTRAAVRFGFEIDFGD
ncbi:transcription factor bHLH35-like [Aristolochia californica]|uniref:transcription factor bHLH35-like n=1 Tax=Aristolochia californica TaxID=171875 RepID=UPI0035D8E804